MDQTFDREVDAVSLLYPAVYRRFHRSASPVFGTDLTQRMAGLLQTLARGGPRTLGELADDLGLGKATVTELVDRIETKGLVSRIRDDRDRRRVFLWLTDQGETVARGVGKVLEDSLLRTALGRMAPEDRRNLIDGLGALLRASEEENHE